jgi:hypothetical protein
MRLMRLKAKDQRRGLENKKLELPGYGGTG